MGIDSSRLLVRSNDIRVGERPRGRHNGEVSGGAGVWTPDNHKGESMNSSIAALLISVSAFAASPALAGSISFKPPIDPRLRYENVDQDGIVEKADALTLRARAGLELGLSKDFIFLVEGEGSLALNEQSNSGAPGRTVYPIVASPVHIAPKRIHLQYKGN